MRTISSLSYSERIRKDLLTQLLDEDRAALHEAILRAVRDRGDSESELRFRSGGRGRWIRVRIRLLSRAGNLSNLYLLAEETTQEQALRDRLAATRDTIPGGLAFYEVADRIRLLDFSDAAADMIGYTREEYQARTLDLRWYIRKIAHASKRWLPNWMRVRRGRRALCAFCAATARWRGCIFQRRRCIETRRRCTWWPCSST